MNRLSIALILAAASLAAHAADDVAQQQVRVLPASGVTDPDHRAVQRDGNVQNNLAFDVSKQVQRDYESRLRAMTPAIPMDFSGSGAPTTIDGPKSRITVIPRATVPGPNAAPYTQVDRFGGGWGAATVNMSAQQARDYDARIQSELAERDKRAVAVRRPEVRFEIPPREIPKPSGTTQPSSNGGRVDAN
ncbi:hypothetical protein [Paraburkholderia humisilvae]|uniref:DUF4148 domain-containing protein n=2 Tax=Paraburkholderia humisilvae TaxID=627669 RepID=A0A6J5E444_9BURK|nr:hypothetical protein [Paraburkholderia humisilvae]CAB3760414.1 hypothetical protein LMG29542_03839 [Paraburkholderia humisilvae]